MMSLRNRRGGFTLIELMIVVAIIGILAAIAIPNFVRFQLRAKSSEGKTNLAAIRTAEEGYFSEFGIYIAAATQPTTLPGSSKKPWNLLPTVVHGFNTIGWAPEGNVYFQYAVATNAAKTVFTADAKADIDGDGTANSQLWGYVKPLQNLTGAVAGAQGCPATGVMNTTVSPPTNTIFNTVGPCTVGSGQSKF